MKTRSRPRSPAVWSCLAVCAAAAPHHVASQAAPALSDAWDRAAAAEYLDERTAWWMDWPVAARDHETACVSCHTTVPYALARPMLRAALGEAGPTLPEARLHTGVRKRVDLWNEVEPFYPDQTVGLPKTSESRGTEAILNALVLASRDAREGHLSEEARQAFDHLWKLQFTRGEGTGGWAWLYFDLAPWESEGAAYFGAALAAVAVGIAPDDYATSPEIQDGLGLLRDYLLSDAEGRSSFDRVMLLWAATALPGLLTPDQGRAVLDEVARLQNDDGGWSLAALGPWTGREGFTPLDASDGYATGLVAYVLLQAGVAPAHPALEHGLAWLSENQDASGRWPAYSLNRERDPESERGLMMSDAATAFAVMALTRGGTRRQ